MKTTRHEEILKLIDRYDIETQDDLVKRLNEAGFRVTQATVSRDIRELQLSKSVSESGRVRYCVSRTTPQAEGKYIRTFKEAAVSMDTAGNLLVVKTESGMAMAAAAALDELGWEEIVGCIAGDDTIFLAIKTPEDAENIKRRLKKLTE